MAKLTMLLEPKASHSQLNAKDLAVKLWEIFSTLCDKDHRWWDGDRF